MVTQAECAEGQLPADEPDWFGDAAPFRTIAELAAALPDHPPIEVRLLPFPATTADEVSDDSGDADDAMRTIFEFIQPERREPESGPQRMPGRRSATTAREPGVMHAQTWSVRIPGVEPLPQRQAGRTGWSLQNSIRILRRAEDLTLRLRQEAVIVAFDGASRAIRGER